jgi:plastocyanin
MRILTAVLMFGLSLVPVRAADIEGQVVIKRKLTKPNVTAAARSYERGISVELGPGQEEDPLAVERTRVVIYLEGELPSAPVTATLEQRNRRFVPDTLVIPAGSAISFPNLDPIFHNVFSLSKPKSFDLGNYPKDQTRTVTFPKPGVVFVHCHLHPNMAAAIVISPNQWNTKPGAAGRFALSGMPPGSYTIVAWHKAAGFFRQSIRVSQDRATHVQFVIPLDDGGAVNAVARR